MQVQAQTPTNRKQVTLTQKQAEDLRQWAKGFELNFEKQKAEFASSEETIYYIVSSKFLKEWNEYATASTLQRYLPSPINIDIVEDGKLKPDLAEGQDFQFLSQNIYKPFFKYEGIQIKRKAIMIGTEKRIPVYLREFKYVIVTVQTLRLVDRNTASLDVRPVEVSQFHTIEDFLESVMDKERYTPDMKQLRLWKIGQKSIEELHKYIKGQTAPLRTYDFKIKFIGKKITEEKAKVGDMEFDQEEFLVIEVKESSKKWHLLGDNDGKCQSCYTITELKVVCGCKKVAYCNEQCMQKDKRFHLRGCTVAEMEQILQPVQMQITENSARGRVGLSNLGNTCFMNSCLQCLSNTEPLTDYFLGRYFEKEINQVNPIGTKGKLAKTYAKFIKSMWCDSNSTFSPYNIKNAVSSINPMFSGYAQHDSQEFFSFLVDGLHQDLNRIQKKPSVQSVDSNGRPDHVVALQSWITHTKRNQSIIVDLMTGQYRSKVTCPDCHCESITFDPFITVTLPIPQKGYSDETVSIDQCFHHLREVQKLDAGNEWYCSNCKQHKQANKQLSIYKAPKILILHLKRFKQKGMMRKEKNDSKVEFPMELNMKDYLIDPLPMSSYIEELKQQNVYMEQKMDNLVTSCDEPIYELYAVSNHYGGLGGGHYTAYGKNNGKWCEFNDSSVRSINGGSVSGSGAYILFYKRKD